ncbi:hypothetical protein NKH18_50385 [Streptomyces sp. M10(2022)]
MREAADGDGADRFRLRPARPADLDEVLTAIAGEHGAAAGALARQWWEQQPTAFTVAEDDRGALVATLVALCLEADAADPPDDPVARAALAHSGPFAAAARRTAAAGTVDHRQYRGGLRRADHALGDHARPGRQLDLHHARAGGLAAVLDLYGQQRAAAAGCSDGERAYPYVQDWRSAPFDRWAAALRARLLTDETPQFAPPGAAAVEPALPWPEFAEAVKHAYRSALDPPLLAESPLLGTRLLAPGADAAALREVLAETVDQLRAQPGEGSWATSWRSPT